MANATVMRASNGVGLFGHRSRASCSPAMVATMKVPPTNAAEVAAAEAGASPQRFLDLGSYHAIVACVAASAGLAVVPADVLEQAVLATEVQRHRLPTRFRVNRTYLVWPREASAPLRAFIDLSPKQRSRARATKH